MRSFSFAMVFVGAGLHIYGKGPPPSAWLALALLCFAYPQFVYWRAGRAADPVQAELRNLLIDSALLGMFAAALGFSAWLSFPVIVATLANSAANRGWRGIAESLASLLAGAAAWIAAFGFTLSPDTEWPAAVFSMLGVTAYIVAMGNVGYARNIKLRDSRARLRAVLDGVDSGVITITDRGIVETFNRSAERIFGYRPDEVIGRNVKMLMPEPDRGEHDGYLDRYRRTGQRAIIGRAREVVALRKDGSTFPMELGVYETLLKGNRSYIGSVSDISFRKQAEAELRIAAAAFESQEGMLVTDAATVILKVNRAFSEMTGYAAAEVIGRTPRLLKSGRHDADFYRAMWEHIGRTGSWQGEIWDKRKNGDIYPKLLTITAVKDEAGTITHYIGTQHDITERKSREQKIQDLAFFDQLTGLPNRTLLLDRLRQAIATSARSGAYGALLFIDLDNFKALNDTLGHDMGDLLLQQVAQRLTLGVREGDTVARQGGDEFVVVLQGLSAQQADAAADVESVAEKLLETLSQPYQLGKTPHLNTASVGVSLFKGDAATIDELMKQADLAMYKSKAAGRNLARFFDPTLESAAKERAALENELRHAVEEQQFLLHYQPQVAAQGRLTGAEALLRWRHPQRGLVPASEFIGLAEDTGLIVPLGHWVLSAACAQLALWSARPETAGLTLSVNISPRQFRLPGFVDQVLAVLAVTGANPERLKLELTEALIAANAQDVAEKMSALSAKGVGFSLDDFGTGYSSLSRLKSLPLGQLKIDLSFVRDLLVDAEDAAIARTIVGLAVSLGLGVIAEGVETEAQRDFLAGSGCLACQGHLFGRPQTAAEFEALLRR